MKGCRPLTDEEIEEISWSFAGKFFYRDRALFILGLKTGFRISELLSLSVSDVYQYGRIVDSVTVNRRHMKRKKSSRTVPLHDMAREALADWIRQRITLLGYSYKSAILFVSNKGENKPITRQHAYYVLRRSASVNELSGKIGTHSMRKTFAKKVHSALEHDLFKTQKALGHASIQSTLSYMSFQEEDIENAIKIA